MQSNFEDNYHSNITDKIKLYIKNNKKTMTDKKTNYFNNIND